MAAATSLEQDYNLSFVSDLCREISLKRIKRHSFIDIITKGERERSIDPDEESHWISVIFLKSSELRFSFKAQFVTDDARQFAANAYGEDLAKEGLSQRLIDEFIKEFCNLMGGGVKEHFEKSGLVTQISLPLLTRGRDDVFFCPDHPEQYEELFLDTWELKLGDKSIICQAIFEVYNKESLSKICNNVIDLDSEDDDHVEFF